jgi:hypothetical protein
MDDVYVVIGELNNDRLYYKNEKLHREDGPAIEYEDGTCLWFIEGKEYTEEEYDKKILEMKVQNPVINEYGTKIWKNEKGEYHRIDGPAIEFMNGDKYWFQNGNRHRTDGPAISLKKGDEYWYQNDLLHREDGPACEYADGDREWYQNGKRHREDGPAIDKVNGDKCWYIEGKHYTEEEFNKKILEMKVQNPEIEYANGIKYWYNGKGEVHREDANGNKEWYKNDKYHKLDGPAVEYANGKKSWYIEGVNYTEEEFNKKIKEMKTTNPEIDEFGNKRWRNEKGEFHRIDGPAIEFVDGYKTWYQNGQKHRIDGPAIEGPHGNNQWWVNGHLHRLDGPAIMLTNGYKDWRIEGKHYTEEEYNKKIAEINKPKPNIDLRSSEIIVPGLVEKVNKQSIMPTKGPNEQITTKNVIKDRLEKAAYRSASRQITNGISNAIVTIAKKKGLSSDTSTALLKFFDTELGVALIGAIVGTGIPYIPKINQDKRALKLAEEFQVEAISTVTDTLLNELLTYILPTVKEVLDTLPTRIKSEEEIEEEVESAEVAKA